jgi:hypothetical protein
MKMVKGRTRTVSAVNHKRRQILPSKVIWDEIIDLFEVFRNNLEGHYGQIGASYLFDSKFSGGCYVDFMDEVYSASHYLVHARLV